VLWVLGNSEGGDEIFGQGQQTPAINKQALGRIVAAFERERVFISAPTQFGRAAVHDAFRRSFQIGDRSVEASRVRKKSVRRSRYPLALAVRVALAAHAPATRPACGRAIHRAVAARRALALAEESRASDFQADFPAAAPPVVPAGLADLRADQSASLRSSNVTEEVTGPPWRCSAEPDQSANTSGYCA
jgi:hypothetical protein